jgi:hypothetical protein
VSIDAPSMISLKSEIDVLEKTRDSFFSFLSFSAITLHTETLLTSLQLQCGRKRWSIRTPHMDPEECATESK